MNFYDLVLRARSCRRFWEAKPLTSKDLAWLVDCARVAPSARNAQDLRFITVTPGPVGDKLFPLLRWAAALKDWNGPEKGERPGGYSAILMPQKGGEMLWADVGVACQTMQLAAASRWWGACMIRSFDQKGATELLNIPADYQIALIMAFGIANERIVVDAMAADGSCAYWRDEYGTHHVPKRALDELIIKVY